MISKEEILNEFFKHQLQIKLFHFQTPSYAAHKASDEYLTKFILNSDAYLEIIQKDKRFDVNNFNLTFNTYKNNTELMTDLEKFKNFLLSCYNYKEFPELTNIRDTLIADAMQFKYLLSFN